LTTSSSRTAARARTRRSRSRRSTPRTSRTTTRSAPAPAESALLTAGAQIPWALRDLVADARIARLFGELRASFDEWRPKTAVLRDVKRKLAPIRRLEVAPEEDAGAPASKL
jgi:hypothetical protein